MRGWEKAFFSSLHVSVLVFQLELSTTAVLPSSRQHPRASPGSAPGSLPALAVCLAPSAGPLWPPDVTEKQIIMNSRANNNELFNTPTHTHAQCQERILNQLPMLLPRAACWSRCLSAQPRLFLQSAVGFGFLPPFLFLTGCS